MQDTLIITSANGISLDARGSRFSALAVENGVIRAVGTEADVAPFLAQGWPVADLKGNTLLPGFTDCHMHMNMTGQMLDGLDLSTVASLAEVLDALADRARTTPPGRWVQAYSLTDMALPEGRMPSRRELDQVSLRHPIIVVQSSWHLCALNSLALDALVLPENLPGMDMEAGDPTGIIRDPGSVSHVFPALCNLRSEETKLAYFRAASARALAQGVTTIHALEGGDYGPGEGALLAANPDAVSQRLVIWNQVMDVEGTLALGLPRIGGCICADGAVDANTAAFFEPYVNEPWNRGTLNFTQAEMDEFVLGAHEAGLQIAVHCESDRSIEQVLSAMEKALKRCPRADHRHRIEHFEVPAPDQIGRMAEAGIIASMQPAFLPCLMTVDDYLRTIGPERLRRLHPYRTMLDAGVRLCGGSDSPVTPVSPLLGVQGAVTHPVEDERITVMEALRLFTSDAAYASFDEAEGGSIEPGKRADLVELDADPLTTHPEVIGSIRVVRTYMDGKPVDQPRDGPQA